MDEITGIAVLQPTWIDGIFRLWFTARRSDGVCSQEFIYIKEKSSSGLPDKMPDIDDSCNSIWKFARTENRLNCEPSVNLVNSNFHNAGTWSVDFVEALKIEPRFGFGAAESDSRWVRGHTIHYDLNAGVPSNVDRDTHIKETIRNMKLEGWLK